MKLPTVKLNEMLTTAIKGASFDKLIPMSSLMAIEIEDGTLSLMTTDGTNYLYVMDDVDAEDFYVVVNADVFSKLIAKTTCEEVSLELTESSLNVIGNGNYKLELELDSDGTPAKLPNPMKDKTFADTQTINRSIIQTMINTAKPSLMEDSSAPCYMGYYVGDMIIATDATQICGIDTKLFREPVLISPAMIDLVGLMSNENIEVAFENNMIIFQDNRTIVYGPAMAYLEDFDAGAISQYFGMSFNTKCKLSKLELNSVLDRLSLFVNKYEKNQIMLTFTKEGLQISSKSSNAVELIKYRSIDNFGEYECLINITMLQTQLKAYANDEVELWYNNDANNAIKLVDGSITQIIALCE